MCFESILNLLKRVTDDRVFFHFHARRWFLHFLNFDSQIRCPQNWYTDLKSTLDLVQVVYNPEFAHFREFSKDHAGK